MSIQNKLFFLFIMDYYFFDDTPACKATRQEILILYITNTTPFLLTISIHSMSRRYRKLIVCL
jgi:hypothetical protein